MNCQNIWYKCLHQKHFWKSTWWIPKGIFIRYIISYIQFGVTKSNLSFYQYFFSIELSKWANLFYKVLQKGGYFTFYFTIRINNKIRTLILREIFVSVDLVHDKIRSNEGEAYDMYFLNGKKLESISFANLDQQLKNYMKVTVIYLKIIITLITVFKSRILDKCNGNPYYFKTLT